MTIKQFHLFHGAVLTTLARSDRPVTLRMIETQPRELWAVYTINDEVHLYVKYSTAVRDLAREPGSSSWTFVFGRDEVARLAELSAARDVYAALVCGRTAISRQEKMHICLLRPEQLAQLVDFRDTSAQPSITVKYVPRSQLRVISGRRVEFLVPQSALARWQVPGG